MDTTSYYFSIMRQLVETPSLSQNEEQCAAVLAEILKKDLSMEVECERLEGRSVNIYGLWKGKTADNKKPAKRLILGGHIDVVAPGEGWRTDPFKLTIVGDRAYGRGAFDMKGGLAAQIVALKKLQELNWEPDGEIEIVGFCDEERLSIGANAYALKHRERDHSSAFGIFAEPHYDNIVVGATGKVLLSLKITGESGHAAEPETGVNAVSCLAKLVSSIDEKYTPLYLQGKVASHSFLRITSRWEGYSLAIPDHAEALLNKQLSLNEKSDIFINELRALHEKETGKGTLDIEILEPYYPSYYIPEGSEGLNLLRNVINAEYGHQPELRINQSVSDANIIYPELGIPIVLFGPDGADLHKPNEYVLWPSALRYIGMIESFTKAYFSGNK